MLRLTWQRTPSCNRLKVEGEITGSERVLFWSECDREIAGGHRFEIDLGGVTYLENADVDRLRSLASNGVKLANCPPFVWALLNYPDQKSERIHKRRSDQRRKRPHETQ